MREFPQAALASRVLARGELTPAHIDALAADVAAFHSRIAVAPRRRRVRHARTTSCALALENFDATRAAADDAAERADARRAARLDAARARRLRAAASCSAASRASSANATATCTSATSALIDGRLTIFDCIEFNDRPALDRRDERGRVRRDGPAGSRRARARAPVPQRLPGDHRRLRGAARAALLSRVSRDGARQGDAPAREPDGRRGGKERAPRRVPRLSRLGAALRAAAATRDRDHARPLRLRQDDADAGIAGADGRRADPHRRRAQAPARACGGGAHGFGDRDAASTRRTRRGRPTIVSSPTRGASSRPATSRSSTRPSCTAGSAISSGSSRPSSAFRS